jgi:cytoskeletal protein CcmA (bactofilin family)
MYRPERCALRRGRVDFSRWFKKPRRVNTCFPDDFTQKEALLMWNRRKEEELVPKPASAPPRLSELAKEGIPMSTLPSRTLEPSFETPRASTNAILGKSVNVKGQIFSREDLTIDGEVEGTVELQEHRLTVGPNGKVLATVKAREIVVLGTVHGNVEATEKIDIRKEAKLVGDIKTARIVIEDGAYFKGNIDIVRTDASRAPAPKPQAVASGPTAVSAPAQGNSAMAAKASEGKR